MKRKMVFCTQAGFWTDSASSFESRMLTFLLFSFHIRRTRGPRKMIFCICNYQSFVSVCAENNLGSVNIHRIIILIWHGVWLLDLQRFLRKKKQKGALVRNSGFTGKRGNG